MHRLSTNSTNTEKPISIDTIGGIKVKETFACKDLGMACDFRTEASSREQLMPKIVEHAKKAHGMTVIPDDLKGKIAAAIKVQH